MFPAVDYQIFQRNSEGYADIYLAGEVPAFVDEPMIVATRVSSEETNMTVISWTECKVNHRHWEITLKVPQGGLYRIETAAGSDDTEPEYRDRIQNVCHVGVGELFMLTGQSNMSGNARDTAYDPPELGVHLYGNNGRWSIATHPLNDSIDTIYPENRETESGISPMLAFARHIKRSLNVPVGLVQASLGGSPLSRWDLQQEGDLTRAMFRRLDAVGSVGCIVWYQGCTEANSDNTDHYFEYFERTVKAWRNRMGSIPVLTVQLNRWVNETRNPRLDHCWGLVCEAQRRAAYEIPDVYIVPSKDLPCCDCIHNSAGSNVILGERLAMVYLNKRYGLPGLIVPDIEKVIRVDDTHLFAKMFDGNEVFTVCDTADGFDAEDASGLIGCVSAKAQNGGLLFELSRPCGKNAKFHAVWRSIPPAFLPRARHGLPILARYGIPVENA